MTESDADIRPIHACDEGRIAEVCSLLVHSFRESSPDWVPTTARARKVVDDALAPGCINRILVLNDRVVGWVGLRHDYGAVWELHPLVVDAALRRRGYGRQLVDAAETLAAHQGGFTLVLGTSDEVGLTSLSGKDLFRDPLAELRELRAAASHPVGFWLNVGFTIVGVVPDAEGEGKPTILLAKRLVRAGS